MNICPICCVPECDLPSYCKGLCKGHYSRQWRTGSLELRRPLADGVWSRRFKACVQCGQTTSKHVGKGKCLVCSRRNLEARHKEQKYDRRKLLKRYGLTLEDYDRMWAVQSGRCAICRECSPSKLVMRGTKLQHVLHIDHDHDTNKARGLLCSQCNRALGQFRDDPRLLIAALAYLETHGKSVMPTSEAKITLQ